MTHVVTIAHRKAREASRRRAAADAVLVGLRAFAVAQNGCFVVFGSVAEARMTFDSDFDVMIDFPADRTSAVTAFVEDLCREHGLRADILIRSEVSDRFLARIADHAVTLS